MRPKPKYFYYYEWMKDRIKEYYPSLPECVMDKLLSLDGAELDLLLQHPQAIRGQTEEFLQVLDQKGEKFLETYKTPQLSWEEVQALRVADAKKKKLLDQIAQLKEACTNEEAYKLRLLKGSDLSTIGNRHFERNELSQKGPMLNDGVQKLGLVA